jgi:predicted RND superfamily exporter protein
MKSFYLAFFSVINLFFAIPVTLVIYTYIVGVEYFSTIHVSVIIVVIGIGADDVFVFHDFYIGSHKIKLIRGIKERLTYTFRKASSAMFVTSLTSAGAFASCIGSRIMPIQAFGVFSAIVVPMIFIQTVVILPVIYYFYEKYIMNNSCCCFCKNKEKVDKDDHPELRLDELESELESKISKDEIMMSQIRKQESEER